MSADQMIDGGAMGGFTWHAMLTWAVLGIALPVLAIGGVAWVVRQLGRDGRVSRRLADRTAIEELARPCARGEIDRETFLATREDLERDGG